MGFMMSPPYMQPNAYPAYANPAQVRLNQMEQQYPQFAVQQQMVQQPMQQPAQQMVNARMVTGREEALGVPVDFSGAPMVFTDLSHGKIYTKVFNAGTGSADMNTYSLDNTPEPAVAGKLSAEDYVTRKEYNELLEIITGGKADAAESTNNSVKTAGKEKSSNGASSESGSKNAGR